MTDTIKIYNKTIWLLMIVFSFTVSCEEEHNFSAEIVNPAQGAQIKFIHAAFDGLKEERLNKTTFIRSVDFYVSNKKISGSSIAYGAPFPVTGYAALTDASSIQVNAPFTVASATIPELPAKQVHSGNLSVSADKHFTVAIVGPQDNREAIVYEDNLSLAPMDGKAYIRFINLISNAANNFNLIGTPPSPADGPPSTSIKLAENIGYKQSSQGFLAITPGAYTNVLVKDAVTDATILTLAGAANANSTFIPNKVYTIYVRGLVGLTAADPERALVERIINR